jgi:hypothetical protein
MKRVAKIIGSICVAAASFAAHAQAFQSLASVEKVPVPRNGVDGFAVQLPIKCGPDGTIYVRFAEAGLEPSVTLIREDGKIASSIRVSAIPEVSGSDFYDFAPGNGDVFVLSGQGKPHSQTTYHISRFKADGTYVSSVKADTAFRPDFEPRQIAAFPSGGLLIAGITKGHEMPFVPFAAIFGEDGGFQRQIIFAGDVTEKNATQAPSDTSFSEAERVRNLLDVSYLQTADDGNAYVMRHTPRGPVFVVSPGGSVRRVALVPPVESANLQWIMASGGSIAAQYRAADFTEPKTHYLTVVDVETKRVRETIRYTHDYQTNGGGMACYQHGTFTFIAGGPDHKLQLVRAVAQ